MTNQSPEIIEVNSQQMEELLDRAASNTLRDEDTELMRQIFDSYVRFFQIVGDKNTTIARLRKMMFGASSEKTEKVVGDTEDQSRTASASDDSCGEHCRLRATTRQLAKTLPGPPRSRAAWGGRLSRRRQVEVHAPDTSGR